ncbi:thiamine phosphate synthase [Paenibacillus spiritus]|uniref:Thiamine-phosphate synthase n=1 Tax=Paenibacillus spiritus TaxID=2496557 RepID=A0A5J5G8R0_9BACL|nr:thiamine phosphate synthase [Paenibacillus spiritus]KAA9004097.1 thiamine phosphate synthase [Paenibacillus spiritus]
MSEFSERFFTSPDSLEAAELRASGELARRWSRGKIAPLLRVYFIMGSADTRGRPPADVLREAIAGGVTLFQFREKGAGALTGPPLLRLARELRAICRASGVPFLVDDDVELALAVGADGVHVGQEDAPAAGLRQRLGPAAILGVSAHTPEEARRAAADGADYIGVGPIYPTGSKPDAKPACGPGLLSALRRYEPDLPMAAIGGLTAGNAAPALAAGADGLAVISAIAAAENPRRAAAELARLYGGGR